jgi:hypothetical protein
MKRFSLVLAVIMLFNFFSKGQNGSLNFKQISREMEKHFDTAGKQHTGYQQFKRWEWYNSTRLSPQGNIINNFRLNNDALRNSTVSRDAAANVIEANTGSWTFLGPNNVNSSNKGIGRANRIAFHPTNPNTMYVAGATGGLWITTYN